MKKVFLSYKDTFKKAWEIFKNNRVNFFYIGIISFIISSIPRLLMNTPEGPLNIYIFPVLIFLSAISGLIIQFAYPLAIVDSIDSSVKGIASDFDSSYSNSLKKFWSYVWISVLSFFNIFGFFSLLIVPGIIFSILLSFTIFTFYLSHKKGLQSLLLSWQYVEGNWWNVLTRMIIFGILFALASIVSVIIFTIILTPLTMLLGINIDLIVNELMTCLQLIVFVPIFFSYLYVVFKELESKKSLSQDDSSPKSEIKKRWLSFGSIFGLVSFIIITILLISIALYMTLSPKRVNIKVDFNNQNTINKNVVLDR